jgi:hypothetical protein
VTPTTASSFAARFAVLTTRPFARALERADRFDLCASMTLLLMLLYAGNPIRLKIAITILVVSAFVFAGLRRHPLFWFVLTAAYVVGSAPDWLKLDNHKYLIAYWCLACGLACLGEQPMKTLAFNARLLIALCFIFSVVWKLLSPDFMDGTFFHFSLLSDRRLAGVARAVGGLDADQQQLNRAAYRALINYNSQLTFVQLASTPSVKLLAGFMTWWTIALESLIAVAFLLPRPGALSAVRDYALLLFIASTYAIAPVVGFGWVLATMGFAQAGGPLRLVHVLYVAALLVLQLDRIPWQTLL